MTIQPPAIGDPLARRVGPVSPHLEMILDDLRRHGQPPPERLVAELRAGALGEADFRAALGIRPVTPDSDRFGEHWRRVPGHSWLEVSNYSRLGSRLGAGPGPASLPRHDPDGDLIGTVEGPDGWETFAVGPLMHRAFGPSRILQPAPDPDPPGVS